MRWSTLHYLKGNVPNFCHNDKLSLMMSWVGCLLTNSGLPDTWNFKRMGLAESLRRIWLFSANKIKSSDSGSKQPTQLIIELNSSLRHIIVTQNWSHLLPVAILEEFVMPNSNQKFYKGKWWYSFGFNFSCRNYADYSGILEFEEFRWLHNTFDSPSVRMNLS